MLRRFERFCLSGLKACSTNFRSSPEAPLPLSGPLLKLPPIRSTSKACHPPSFRHTPTPLKYFSCIHDDNFCRTMK